MQTWNTRPKLRDDDPYHSWAFHEAYDAQTDADGEDLCAIVVEVPFPDAEEEAEGRDLLAGQLVAIEGLVQERIEGFWAPKFEEQHLRASRNAVAEGGLPPDLWKPEGTLYLRLFVLYAPEPSLFPTDAEGRPLERSEVWAELFDIRYTSRPSRSLRREPLGPLRVAEKDGEQPLSELAIIDDSIAFLNSAFDVGGRTLFENIWFQELDRSGVSDAITGTRLGREDIDALLDRIAAPQDDATEARLYQSGIQGIEGGVIRLVDFTSLAHQPLAWGISHGTHVADTALRAFTAQGGDLAALRLSAVTLPAEVTQDTSGQALGPYLLAAIRQAMLWNDGFGEDGADHVPLIISCSYGYMAGLKDGTDPLSKVIADILLGRNELGRDTALVLPMGNDFEDRTVAHLELESGGFYQFDLILSPDDRTPSFLDVFGSWDGEGGAAAGLEISITPPHGAPPLHVRTATLSEDTRITLNAKSTALVAEWSQWPVSGSSEFDFRGTLCLARTADPELPDRVVPSGRWAIRIQNDAQTAADVWAFVQRDDAPGTYPEQGRQAFLETDLSFAYDDRRHPHATLSYDALAPGSIVTGTRTVSVLPCIDSPFVFVAGAGEGESGDKDDAPVVRASRYSSAGPRDGVEAGGLGVLINGPEFSPLSDRSPDFPGRYGAATLSGDTFALSGSSVAAPQLAGWLAANPDQIRNKLAIVAPEGSTEPGAPPRDAQTGRVL